MNALERSVVLMVILTALAGCADTKTTAAEGCQEQETIDGMCSIADDSNVRLFGQDLDAYVESTELDKGFLARPKGNASYPGIIMIHEWWGLNDNIKEMARILAKEGYIVYAIDLYGAEPANESARARELATAVRENPEKAIKDMKEAVAYLKSIGVEKVASIGWCFGGQQSLLLSLNEKMDATVIYYGNLVDDKERLKSMTWPILGIFGDKDTSIPVESVEKFRSSLDELGIENEIHIYPGVGHAFANPSGSNYAADETVDAWKKTVAFLDKNLKGQSD